ncbi:MAG: hypothetical protein RDU89_11720 [bacterium]|nr:hypothetical protein [bacterium]
MLRLLALAALLFLVVASAVAWNRRAGSLAGIEMPAPVADEPVAVPAGPHCYPPHRYHIEAPVVHRAAASLPGFPSTEYWVIGGDPVTIEIRFKETIPDPAEVISHLRSFYPLALVHEEGHEADRVFVRVTLAPRRYAISLLGIGGSVDQVYPTLVLDQGAPYHLVRWEPGGSPRVLGQYFLPRHPFEAGLESDREEGFWTTESPEGLSGCRTVDTYLWRWQSGTQPRVALLPGLWTTGRVFHRSDDLVLQSYWSVTVVDRSGEPVAPLGHAYSYGVAVGPDDEVAVFLGRYGEDTGLELDLMIFDADLKLCRTWDGICPQGRFNDGTPDVHPIWWGDEVYWLALDDTGPDRPVYRLMAIDVDTGSVREVLGPFAYGYRVGRSHYALREDDHAAWVLWDPATSSLRTLLSAREVGERWAPRPLVTNGDWVVLHSSESGLLGWHPSLGITYLGPGSGVVRAGEAFLWWTEAE